MKNETKIYINNDVVVVTNSNSLHRSPIQFGQHNLDRLFSTKQQHLNNGGVQQWN